MFVTNNRADFVALYGREDVHAGLVVVLPNVIPAPQRALFKAALGHIGDRDVTNYVVEVEATQSEVVIREYSHPA